MAIKLQRIDNYFIITNTVTGHEDRYPTADIYFRVETKTVAFSHKFNRSLIHSFLWTDLVDKDLISITKAQAIAFLEKNTGGQQEIDVNLITDPINTNVTNNPLSTSPRDSFTIGALIIGMDDMDNVYRLVNDLDLVNKDIFTPFTSKSIIYSVPIGKVFVVGVTSIAVIAKKDCLAFGYADDAIGTNYVELFNKKTLTPNDNYRGSSQFLFTIPSLKFPITFSVKDITEGKMYLDGLERDETPQTLSFTQNTDVFYPNNDMNVFVKNTVDVSVQDPINSLMVVNMSNVLAETTLSTTVSINDYGINVTDSTGFIVGQYLTIYDVLSNRVFFSNILSIAVNFITLDTPIDFTYPSNSFVTIGNTNLNVDGSVTPQIFGVRNPGGQDVPLEFDITRIMFLCLTNGSVDLSKFGDISGGLNRGIVMRRVDGDTRNILRAKTNGDLKGLMYDLEIQVAQGNQQNGFTGRLTLGGQNRLGAVIRIGADEDFQIVIQDDLTSLDSFSIIVEGHEVVD